LPTPACGRVSSGLPCERSVRGAAFILILALAVLLAGCFLQGKQPAAQTTPAPPAPAAKSSAAPPQPLSVPQTQIEIPTPQPVSEAALAAGQTSQDAPEPVAPPRPVRRSPPAVNAARPEAPASPAATEEPTRAPIQEVLTADESKRLQDSAAEHKHEIRRLVDQARLRRLNGHELSVVARIEGMVKLSDDAGAKGDMREADALAERALVLAKDLDSER